MKIGAYGNPIQNIASAQWRKGSELQGAVLYKHPKVDQLGRYEPKEFLKQSLYS